MLTSQIAAYGVKKSNIKCAHLRQSHQQSTLAQFQGQQLLPPLLLFHSSQCSNGPDKPPHGCLRQYTPANLHQSLSIKETHVLVGAFSLANKQSENDMSFLNTHHQYGDQITIYDIMYQVSVHTPCISYK